jgi:hypothetical protein
MSMRHIVAGACAPAQKLESRVFNQWWKTTHTNLIENSIGSYPIYFTSASLSNTLMFPYILNTHIPYNPIDRYCQVV